MTETAWPTKPKIFTEKNLWTCYRAFYGTGVTRNALGVYNMRTLPRSSGIGMFICENCYKEHHRFFLDFLARWCLCVHL